MKKNSQVNPVGETEPPNSRPPRLVDVAKLAQVSRATAARALGGYGLVTEETQKKVEAASAQLGYRTNELARAMRAGRSLTIGLVVANISDSFFDRATRAIIDTASKAGYQVLVVDTHDDLEAEKRAVEVLLEKRVDGLIVVPSSADATGHLLRDGAPVAPMILLDRRLSGLDVGTVTTNDFASAVHAVELFLSRGHQRIGLLATSSEPHSIAPGGMKGAISAVRDRVEGYLHGIMAAGFAPESGWVRFSRDEHNEACRSALEMLCLPSRPTAVLTTNAEAALAVIDACQQLGLRVGPDVSLVSFDDASWAKVFRPSVSVLDRPVLELGETAVKSLLAQIQLPKGRVDSVVLENHLIDRESVALVSTGDRAITGTSDLQTQGVPHNN